MVNIFCFWVFIIFLFFTLVSSNSVKIDKLIVPEVVDMYNHNHVTLDCQFSVSPGEAYTVRWFFNHSNTPVYQWSPGVEPVVSGVLEGRLNLSYEISSSLDKDLQALRVAELSPEVSGEYTCCVTTATAEARQTQSMFVFSSERELELNIEDRDNDNVEIKCRARGLHPQPDLKLETERYGIPRQQQRIWRSVGFLYDTEATAPLKRSDCHMYQQVTCRLHLHQVDYTAIRKINLASKEHCSNTARVSLLSYNVLLTTTLIQYILSPV